MYFVTFYIILFGTFNLLFCQNINKEKFPDQFKFGFATSSYQIEGAWNDNGKGESNWDYLTHNFPEKIKDRSNGDIACDSYNKYKEDIKMLKEIGVDLYRFSLSWTRILPFGITKLINEDGIRYYNNLINRLLASGIEPVVTIYHWEMPIRIQEMGGWENELMVDYLVEFADLAFDNFGDRVKRWITINEPTIICRLIYSKHISPEYNHTGIGDYICGHNILKAHAKIYRLYEKKYKQKQKGRVGITLNAFWHEPFSLYPKDIEAAEISNQFDIGWFLNPITNGDYPEIMKKRVRERSEVEGFSKSRLPDFTQSDVALIKGSMDFLGLNHYTTLLTKYHKYPIGWPSVDADKKSEETVDPNWPPSASKILYIVPWGFRKILNYIKINFLNPEILITENGYPDFGEICDFNRTRYHQEYLSALLDSIHEDSVNISGYIAWSLMDNFEWISGYTMKYGMFSVDFNSIERPRTPKYSSKFYADLIKQRRIPQKITRDCKN